MRIFVVLKVEVSGRLSVYSDESKDLGLISVSATDVFGEELKAVATT